MSKKKNVIYRLIYEDMSHVSDRMGTAYSTKNTLDVFSSPAKAKAAAEKNYNQYTKSTSKRASFYAPWKKDAWTKTSDGWQTGDLLFVMYHIKAAG